jgi:hypothetical protein
MLKTTVYLPERIQQALADAAHLAGRPQAELIREALETYLDRVPRPELLSIGIADDPTVSGRDSAAWLREQWDER